ncbi:MAG: TolC family protein [Bacteroidaceae bacterium]|nr:TolC family protein [Bacteroidaceae bacterium]MBR5149590.1 TolC family protein [Bacteroidaceae bacterium]
MMMAALALCAMGAMAQETLRLTLDQAIEIALSDNPTIEVAEQTVELKKISDKETVLGLLPEASLSGAYTRTIKKQTMVMNGMKFQVGIPNQYQGGLTVSLPVFAPALYKSMKLTKTDVALAVEQARASKQDLVNQVTKAFFQMLLAQDSYAVLEKSYAQAEANFNIVKAKFEQGRVSEYDKISAEVQMRNLQPSVISARNAVELSRLQLVVLMNIEPETDFTLDGNLGDYEEEVFAGVLTADSTSLKNNTSLLQMDMNTKMLQQSLSLNKQSFAPMVALQFNYMYTCMADNFEFKSYEWNPYSNVSLSVSIPLFKYSNFSAVKKTNLQINQLMVNRNYTARQLAMQQQSYLNSMAASAEQVSSNKEAIVQAQKGRDIAEKLYEVGRGTVLELNSAEVALTQARLTYTQSIYDYLTAKADLDKLQGKDYVK